jgi:hypothetical protein
VSLPRLEWMAGQIHLETFPDAGNSYEATRRNAVLRSADGCYLTQDPVARSPARRVVRAKVDVCGGTYVTTRRLLHNALEGQRRSSCPTAAQS